MSGEHAKSPASAKHAESAASAEQAGNAAQAGAPRRPERRAGRER
jgi:hypothetical protein